MKDRSRLLSSVIVSLLAGFIYYQFGEDIQNKLNRSFKAVISYNDNEIYGPEHCQSFNTIVKKSDVKVGKKSKFYIRKKNTIEFKKNDVTIPGDGMLTDIISRTQANVRKATPDKNLDFSAELNNLIKSTTDKKEGKDFKADWKLNKTDGEVADNKSSKSNVLMIIKGLGNSDKGSKFDENTGYGFEYNHTIENEYGEKNDVKIKTGNINKSSNSECNSNSERNCTKEKVEIKTEKRVKVIIPKLDEDVEIDLPEMNIQDDCSEEDPM